MVYENQTINYNSNDVNDLIIVDYTMKSYLIFIFFQR